MAEDPAQQGSTVRVHYAAKLEDGTLIESSQEQEPLEFTVGEGRIIPGLEEAVVGMAPGEQKTVQVEPDRAYGPHREDLIVDVSRSKLPDDLSPEVGQKLQMQSEQGQTFPVTVTEVFDEEIRLDANHPLAGRALTFELELVERR